MQLLCKKNSQVWKQKAMVDISSLLSLALLLSLTHTYTHKYPLCHVPPAIFKEKRDATLITGLPTKTAAPCPVFPSMSSLIKQMCILVALGCVLCPSFPHLPPYGSILLADAGEVSYRLQLYLMPSYLSACLSLNIQSCHRLHPSRDPLR